MLTHTVETSKEISPTKDDDDDDDDDYAKNNNNTLRHSFHTFQLQMLM
jgi:hypothetical protein